MTTKPKCPWDKPTMRENVKRAIDNVGGRRGFAYLSRAMQEAVIDQMLFHKFQTAAQFAVTPITFDAMVGARNVAYEIAGLDDGEDEP
jgi:hypothetical protein